MDTNILYILVPSLTLYFVMIKSALKDERKEARKRYREYGDLHPELTHEEIKSLVVYSLADPNGPACH